MFFCLTFIPGPKSLTYRLTQRPMSYIPCPLCQLTMGQLLMKIINVFTKESFSDQFCTSTTTFYLTNYQVWLQGAIKIFKVFLCGVWCGVYYHVLMRTTI